MGFKIEKNDQYWKCLEEAYDPELTTERAKELLEGFLYFKSKTIGQQSGTPQKAEDAITHLQHFLGSETDKAAKSVLTLIFGNPIIVTAIGGLIVLAAWQFIGPFFGAQPQ